MFAENLKKLRRERGMSQEELANRLGVVRQTVSKWESGASLPDAGLLVKLAEVFQVSTDELLGIAGNAGSNPSQTDDGHAQPAGKTERILIAAAILGAVHISGIVL